MTALQFRSLLGFTVPALLTLLFPAVQVFARPADGDGPLYTSSRSIGEAQSVLKAEHYLAPGRPATGQMDESTMEAIRAFQRDHFIPGSGLLDHETMAQLSTHETALRVAQGRSSRAAQQIVRKQGVPSAPTSPASDKQAFLRTMPRTASPIPLMTGLGALLLAGGLLLGRRQRA